MTSPDPRIDRSIALVGLMGAGKTSVGRRLARRLGLPFVDSDEEVERAADLPVPDIFDRFGEAAFRDCERRVLARLATGPPQVIATGGGGFADEEIRRLLLERCLTIWLDADPSILAERVGRRGDRPLLRSGEPVEILSRLGDLRRPFYAMAHVRVVSDASSHGRVVEEIVRQIGMS